VILGSLANAGVAVEKGTKAVILGISASAANEHSIPYEANFVVETPRKEFFNSHMP
jgi:hypothetical protein